jgi:hypothetical protein
MAGTIHMNFNDNPSALFTLWQALMNRSSRLKSCENVPEIHAIRSGASIDRTHLNDFYNICEIPPTPDINILYPLTLAYPYMMRILCRKEMPFSLFKILNTRNSILMHRGISSDEVLDIDCYNSGPRVSSKGLELDIISEASIGKEKVWDSTTTYFVRGNFTAINEYYTPPKLDPINNAQVEHEWYLAAKDRFRFARISGDTNGIHYWTLYARLLGFERDFAQPIRVVAKCVSSLPELGKNKPLRLDFFLKGPVYYESALILKNQKIKNGNRFNLYRKGNDKPSIEASLCVA